MLPTYFTMKMETGHRVEQLKRATDRIQREIEEVTEREHELRNVGSIKTTSLETVDAKIRRMPVALISGQLKRATSTPQISEAITATPSLSNTHPKMTNGVVSARSTPPLPLRFTPTPSQKGLMHRFLATRGKLCRPTTFVNDIPTPPTSPITAAAATTPSSPCGVKMLDKNRNVQLYCQQEDGDLVKKPPMRKGYVPVEEKIQKELQDMRERENELRLMRSRLLAKSQPNLLDIANDHYSDIYDGSGSLKSGTSSNTLNDDEVERENKEKRKLNPRRRSTLIAQWENLIAAKKETTEYATDNDTSF